jgi:hypothetical protein
VATCFVIQPFDAGAFDKRYDDVFVPAITDAGLEPYRVDRDPAVVIPIEDIEGGIRKASICLADISIANPNVWFELGYAIAADKPVVIVCSHDPARRFPFDIQHRAVFSYRTESARDFVELREQVTARLKLALRKEDTLGRLAESAVVADVEGLNPSEIMALATIAAGIDGPEDEVSTWSVRRDMEKAGYTPIATTLGLRSLFIKGMVASERRTDRDGDPYTVYQVTPLGFAWLLQNQARLVLRRNQPAAASPLNDDDIPF